MSVQLLYRGRTAPIELTSLAPSTAWTCCSRAALAKVFFRHMAARGVQVVATSESDPRPAVEAFFAGRARSPSEGCNHDHCDLGDRADAGHTCNCHSQHSAAQERIQAIALAIKF